MERKHNKPTPPNHRRNCKRMNREKLENMMTNIWGEQFAKEKADLVMRRHGMLDVKL